MVYDKKRIAQGMMISDFNLIIKQFGYPVSQKKFLLLIYINIYYLS